MADNKKTPKPPTAEAVYDVASLTDGAAAWKTFGYAPELAAIALKLDGKKEYTVPEAKRVVKAFAERKVK
jgi:hypothetical protein